MPALSRTQTRRFVEAVEIRFGAEVSVDGTTISFLVGDRPVTVDGNTRQIQAGAMILEGESFRGRGFLEKMIESIEDACSIQYGHSVDEAFSEGIFSEEGGEEASSEDSSGEDDAVDLGPRAPVLPSRPKRVATQGDRVFYSKA